VISIDDDKKKMSIETMNTGGKFNLLLAGSPHLATSESDNSSTTMDTNDALKNVLDDGSTQSFGTDESMESTQEKSTADGNESKEEGKNDKSEVTAAAVTNYRAKYFDRTLQ
jgi:hypothetical protein